MKRNFKQNSLSIFKKLSFTILFSIATTNASAETTPLEVQFGSLGYSFFITPNLSTTETWTDNLFPDNAIKTSGSITEISPGINLKKTSGKLRGYLNYSLNSINYNGIESKSLLQNALNTSAIAEVIEGHGFVEINGLISQQTISAFSVQTNNNNYNKNKTEVSTYSLVPSYRGRLVDILDYEGKYSLSSTNVKNAAKFSSIDSLITINLSGNKFLGKLSWTLSGNHQVISRDIGSNTEVDSLKLSFIYPITNKLIFSVSGGKVKENYSSFEKQSSTTSGMGLNWYVSERTKLTTNIENNSLGKVYSVNFEHATPRTIWKVSDIKSVSLSNSSINTGLGNTYDLLFTQFSAGERDPIKIAQRVNEFLQLYGISPNTFSVNGYLTARNYIQHTQNISFALLGIRDTITFTAVRNVGKGIANSILVSDDFNNSSYIQQSGFTVVYSHRLTEDTVFSNQLSNQNIHGDLSSQNSQLKTFIISSSTRVASKAYLTLSARHAVSSSTVSPFRETAIVGSLNLQF